MFPAEPVPDRIGAYEVLKHVGRVGAADVYTARMDGPLGFSRDVTLKLVSGYGDDARFAEELAREAAICARLNHPVVVRMFDFFEYESRLVLVLEQVEGASLDRLVAHLTRRKQRLGDAGIFFLASQLGAALAHAHASMDEGGNLSPVIHRDIKPENVLVGWDGNVRLSGFGLGKILGRTPDSVAGTVRGTPGYMSPEQARGERATVRSDVYGFGVLLWSLLTGQEPPTDGTRPEPLAAHRPDLPKELLAAVDAALEPSPDKRRITCAEVAQWLAKLTKPDPGREELRQKVLWLRATRGPASKVDTTNKAPRVPKRRQAVQATRPSARRSSYAPPSSRAPASSRVPPSSKSPPASASNNPPSHHHEETSPSKLPPPPSVHPQARLGTLVMKAVPDKPASSRAPRTENGGPATHKSSLPTARPSGERDGDVLLRLPPPPPLPGKGDNSSDSRAPQSNGRGPSSVAPGTLRPASSVSVRTVSGPPSPRTVPPPFRHALADEDVFAIGKPPQTWTDPTTPLDATIPIGAGETTETNAAISVGPHGYRTTPTPTRDGPDTVRPQKPAQMTFTLTTQLLLAALTAALVVTVGLLVGTRSQNTAAPPAQVVTVELNRGQSDPPRQAREEVRSEPARSDPAPTPPTTAPTVANAPPTPPDKPTASEDPPELGDTMGYLTVKGPANADVYINGVKRGPTNEALPVACGQYFMRLAPKDSVGFFKAWMSAGQTVVVECRGWTTVTSKPLQPGEAYGKNLPVPSNKRTSAKSL